MSESTIAKKNAGQKPETAKPETNFDASNMRSAFTTSEKRPRVTRVIGNVRIEMTGLMKRLISAHTIASTSAPISVTSMPGIRYAAISIARVETIQ